RPPRTPTRFPYTTLFRSLAGAIAPIDSATRLPRTTEEDRHQEHFKTDHLLPNLRQRTISSGLITAVAEGVRFSMNLAYIMLLARSEEHTSELQSRSDLVC